MATITVDPRYTVNAVSVTRDPESWVLPTVLFSSSCILIGALWDISWHMTIGRDSLWSPPHLLEQFGAAAAGITCGVYVLWLTFAAPEDARARTVRFWGFRGPFGAWVCIWGAFAMIASLPFDNWWHNAYGLDVEILSPPHAVLMTGIGGIQIGAALFALAAQNRADAARRRRYGWAFTYAYGVLILMFALGGYEYIAYANEWHRSGFYVIAACLFPFLLAGVARASRLRWPATAAAATYMGLMLATTWILQLFPAEPKLAPIYNRVDHMVPLAFPLVLIAPALIIDLLHSKFGDRADWKLAALIGITFVAAMLAVHWPFGEFMLSPAARNFFFASDQWPYMYRMDEWRHEFWRMDARLEDFLRGIGLAVVYGIISARIGLGWGNWTRRVMR
ncbi:MAG: hypothetical protein WEE89_07935 [Gemmatimonadota bacterium]